MLPLTGASKPFALVQRDFDQAQGQFSPDGRWVAYASNESGRYEVLVRRFAEPRDDLSTNPETVVVSTNGGTAPRWRADGKELYFIAADGAVMVTDVLGGAQLSVGIPRALFRIAGSHGDWDVASTALAFSSRSRQAPTRPPRSPSCGIASPSFQVRRSDSSRIFSSLLEGGRALGARIIDDLSRMVRAYRALKVVLQFPFRSFAVMCCPARPFFNASCIWSA